MRKNLSQQKLLEILIAEIETLQQTSKHIKEIAPEIARQLHVLKTTKLKFDLNTDKLEELLESHKQKECGHSKVFFIIIRSCDNMASHSKYFYPIICFRNQYLVSYSSCFWIAIQPYSF